MNAPRANGVAVRATLAVSGVMTSIAGLQLFVASDDTDRYFAWTIRPPLTAAFLGAAYWAALVLVAIAARERVWANARVAAVAALVVVPLIMVVTFVHLDKFHTDADETMTLVGTWLFIATYVWLSALLAAVVVRQFRTAGADPPRLQPLPAWARGALAVQAAVVACVGVALLVAPSTAADLWPWPLTELTARATGAWAVGIGVPAALGVWENDWRRIRAPLAAYVALPVLAGIALARYSATVDWSHPGSWSVVVVLASMLAVGLIGLRAGLGSGSAAEERAVAAADAANLSRG